MAQLTPGVTIERGDVVTRQTIYDLVRLAAIGTVQASDLDASVITILAQSNAPTPQPGLVWYDQTQQLQKVWTDVIDGTSCSLWLAFGPDRFDTAFYATEPIPFGAAVVPAPGFVRGIALPRHPTVINALGYTAGRFENFRVIGFAQNGQHGTTTNATTPSGAWCAVGTAGIVTAWAPLYHSTVNLLGLKKETMCGLLSMWSGLTGASGMTDIRGGVMFEARADGATILGGAVAGHPLWDVKNASQPSGFIMEAWGKILFNGPCWQ